MDTSPNFESIKQVNALGQDYWSARDLMPTLGYGYWQNFEKVIRRAINICKIAQQSIQEHFFITDRIVSGGYGSKIVIRDYHLTRYAFHLILAISDIKKPIIARALCYFTLTYLDGEQSTPQDRDIPICPDIAVTKEQETIGQIKRAFSHLTAVLQYKIHPYRIDLYFPDCKIAVECDEENHRGYNKENEWKRQQYIEHELDCRFVRYDPDDPGFNIGDVIHEIMMLIYENGKNDKNAKYSVAAVLA